VGLSIGFTNDDFNPVISASLGGQRYLVSWMRSATNEITNCSRIVGQEETHSGEFIGAIHSLGDICSSHPTIVSGPKSDFLVIFDIGISPAKKEIRGSLLGYRMFFPLNVK
jgi:hypothetical protein